MFGLKSFIANKKVALFEKIKSVRDTDRFKGHRGGESCGNKNWSSLSKYYRKKKRRVQQASRKANRI